MYKQDKKRIKRYKNDRGKEKNFINIETKANKNKLNEEREREREREREEKKQTKNMYKINQR